MIDLEEFTDERQAFVKKVSVALSSSVRSSSSSFEGALCTGTAHSAHATAEVAASSGTMMPKTL